MTTRLATLVVLATPLAVLAAKPESSLRGAQTAPAPGAGVQRGLAEAYEYLGCFAGGETSTLGPPMWSDDMTLEFCYERCQSIGAHYMSTRGGDECLCSREEDLYYSANGPGTCDVDCVGDSDENCGGSSSYALYKLVAAQEPTDPEYVGCYGDATDRVMDDMLVRADMTPSRCRDHCDDAGAKFYATQYGVECFCGASGDLDDYTVNAGATCHMPCGGDESVACGGYYALSLYKFGDDDAPAPTPSTAPEPESAPEPEAASTSPVEGGMYGTTFSGDATYYGFTTEGNCAFKSSVPGMYDGMIPIALNAPQYGDSTMCGACLEGTANGNGEGRTPVSASFRGYITDQCPECLEGDLDFSMSGDGRWDIEWAFVACRGEEVYFEFEGSNPFYWKLSPRGTKTPVISLTINGQETARTDDNHFILEGGPWTGPQTVVTKTIGGVRETNQVSL